MFEKIKAWIKRKRETAREQQAADRLIKHIEQALGFELYEWQRLYIITGIWQPPEGRLHGRTTAYILRLLLDQSKPLLLYEFCVIEKDSTKSMIYGYRAESVIVDCYNEGDVSTGMRIRFTALGTVSNQILLNVDTEEFIQINATMKTGDVIEINTKYGSKGAKLIRDGVETDYFRYIDVDSTFMQLAIGDNMFRYDAASGVNSLEVSIFYSKEFLGV